MVGLQWITNEIAKLPFIYRNHSFWLKFTQLSFNYYILQASGVERCFRYSFASKVGRVVVDYVVYGGHAVC